MKNKKILIILLPITLIIWSLIFVKIKMPYDNDSLIAKPYQTIRGNQEINKGERVIKHSFIRDPFRTTERSVIDIPKEGSYAANPPAPMLPLPSLEYNGLIINNLTGDRIAILKIDSEEHIIKQNERIEKVNAIYIDSDSIVIEYEGQIKSIKKAN